MNEDLIRDQETGAAMAWIVIGLMMIIMCIAAYAQRQYYYRRAKKSMGETP